MSGKNMKAWIVREKNEFCAAVVFVQTRGKAKVLAMPPKPACSAHRRQVLLLLWVQNAVYRKRNTGGQAMKEYIEREALLSSREKAIWVYENANILNAKAIREALKPLLDDILNIPTAEVVSKSAFEQVVWERDTALRQLREDYGVGLGEKKRDVVEVRHGEWIPVDEKRDAFDCSECDAMVSRTMNYCPNCGARMTGESENA